MKTVRQAIIDEIYYPIPEGLVDNKMIERGVNGDDEFTIETARSVSYKGCLADCLYSLVQAVNISESDKSIGALTDQQRSLILRKANTLYKSIGEDEKDDGKASVTIESLKTTWRPWQY